MIVGRCCGVEALRKILNQHQIGGRAELFDIQNRASVGRDGKVAVLNVAFSGTATTRSRPVSTSITRIGASGTDSQAT